MKLEEVSNANPKTENIRVLDIAHALSNICRYGGHCTRFYSVAQHSVFCSKQLGTPLEQMEFLMHDASEAYLIDLPRLIKRGMPMYREIEDNLLYVIFKHFGFNSLNGAEKLKPYSENIFSLAEY